MKRKYVAFLLALTIIAGILAGCAPASSTPPSAAPGGQSNPPAGTDTPSAEPVTFKQLYGSEVTTMNYLISGSTNDLVIPANVVDTLVEYDNYGVIKPALAESWEESEDGLKWTFKIRPGIYWVDSQGAQVAEVTAEDWVSSAKYVNDAANDSSTQYMFNGIVKNAEAYYDATAALLEAQTAADEGGYETVEAYFEATDTPAVELIDFSEVGVKAVDKYTLEFELEAPKPFFVSVLSYAGYFPVYGPFLEEKGSSFGVDKDNLLYNGAYILSEFQPQVTRVLTKNPTYWDIDNVLIDELEWIYNAEAGTLAPEMFLRGEVDYASVGADLLDDWLANDATKDLVSGSRVDNSYSYFFAFNFDPQFDAAYEPENWKLAVNNENFRLSIQAGLNRLEAKSVHEPHAPENLINNSITPANFATTASGTDYVNFAPLKGYTDGDTYDEAKALSYKEAAISELTAAGATFPVKILMPYNPNTTDWDLECQVIEQQLETLLGSDYIDIIVEAGPSTGFLSAVRRAGMYALMKCNWGADYADPETWAEPFGSSNSYNFMYKSEDAATAAKVAEYYTLVDAAKAITDNDDLRYEAFAKAEAFLIRSGIVIPYSVDTNGYRATKLDQFEGQYAPYGLAQQRYKGQSRRETALSMAEFDATYEAWKTGREAALKAAAGN